jgi:hypothetical protein
MMKYKVGDKVKIRKNLEIGRVYGNYYVTQRMHDLGGAIVRIAKVFKDDGCYRIDSCSLNWTDEMFEGKKKMNDNGNIYIRIKGNQVIAIHAETGKKGVARCHPDDDFDFYVGAKIALERLEEIEEPYRWLKVGMSYYIPNIGSNTLYAKYPYNADRWARMYMERGIVFQTKEEAIACAKKMLAAVKQEG